MTDSDPLENLLPSLVQCFGVIFIGYLSVRLNLITSQAGAIGTYVTKFALPALFFRSMASINFTDVNWLFILAVAISKLVLFFITCICTIIITRPTNFGKAGIFSMFITQSNDVALGYPILFSLYPDLAKYIYLFAPAQLVIINPLCFVLLELHEYRSAISNSSTAYISPKWRILLIFKNVILNPLIFMTVIGVIVNFILSHKLPLVIDKILQILADSFGGVALFYLGMNMVGKTKAITKKGFYLLVFLLLGKLVFLPFLTREVVVHILNIHYPSNQSMNYSLVAFLYGGLPTAPPVFLIANNFQVLPDLIATGLVMCTFISGPLMFITARVITMVVASKSQYDGILMSTAVSISILSLVSCIWVLLVFILSRRYRSPIHKVTMCYTVCLMLTCSGAIVGRIFTRDFSNKTSKPMSMGHYFQFSIFFAGCVGARIWAVFIAAALMIVKRKTISYLSKSMKYFYISGLCIPVAITAMLVTFSKNLTIVDVDPSFLYGGPQLIASLLVFVTCITTIIIFLILEARYTKPNSIQSGDSTQKLIDADPLSVESEPECHFSDEENELCRRIRSIGSSINSDVVNNPETLITTNSEWTIPENKFQIQRHLILILIVVVTMTFGLFLCLWRLIKEDISGVYVELEFLDCAFNFGQGFILWMIFGLDTELIVIPFKNRIMAFLSRIQELYIPQRKHLSPDVITIKNQFSQFHLENCRCDIVKDIRYMLQLYKDVFTGKELVEWIVRRGLASSRADAIAYVQALWTTGVIDNVGKIKYLIDDDESLYRFTKSVSNCDSDQIDCSQRDSFNVGPGH